MKLEELLDLIDGETLTEEAELSREIRGGCGADLMSDVLAFIKPHALLLTGLTNVQAVRTAEIAEVKAIVYVRGKLPEPAAIELAREKGIVLLATRLPMFESCGRLYSQGLPGGSELQEVATHAGRQSVSSKL